jgi:SAM-dependent methyltransferase
MTDAYRDDLAYIHDAGFGGLAGHAAPMVLAALRDHALRQGLVVDLGCGSGILAAALSSAGYDVLGIDLSAPLLALARWRAPGAHFREGSLWAADIPPCVAVTATGECFNYLFDCGNSPEALEGLFRRIHGALCPGGLLVFDVAEPGHVPAPGVARVHAEGPDWAVLVTAEEDGRQRLLTRHITTFRQVGELYRRDHEVHRLRLLPRSETAEQMREAGFQAQALTGYGELRFAPGHVGFMASKS